MEYRQLSLFEDAIGELKKAGAKDEGSGMPDYSCFATYRSEAGGVKYGKCVYNHCCAECEAHRTFYEKAEEYQAEGNGWGKSVALARSFFEIPTVSEYEVEAYQ